MVSDETATINASVSERDGQPFISVSSIWKVFGRNPERILEPQYAGKDKSFFQSEFGNVVGLQDVSFTVNRGETFVIMGLSGSGKSTMVRCLIRLIEPTAGDIVIDGEHITGMSDKELMEFRREKIAMVFQHYGLQPHRNVLDNASWGLEVQGVNKPERYARTKEVLALVGLAGWEEAYPRQLSGGMQQRVGLARALAVDTDILLMDEPFSGLDPLIRRQMQDELLRLQTDLHKTIVFITHDLNEALKLGDRIAIMHDGQVAQIGSPEDIVLRPEDEYVGDFTQDVRLESVLTASKVMVTPKATVMGHQGPRAALHTIGNSDGDAAWVVDMREHYIGMLSITDAERALRAGIKRIDEAWEYVDREYQAVSPTTTFDELIPMAMGSNFPIPCCDEDNVLVGEVHRSALAEAIAETSNPNTDYEANAAENAALAEE
ncbi:MAG: glycine betaine/L-proline ABC transporter ATP-binding protein [Chloroflexota bacterium]|nr:glycine betaine/L-proline ABC transporter ATP-binding protein [Chloroflexota bacterium]MDE2685449.1 glycine betaine/L-proline ABC transporter ATP-binding protein [Chloroflexota bacterium]